MYGDYDHIVPKDWFFTSWDQFSKPIEVQRGVDYFVALGDSFTCGFQMESYSQTWASQLTDRRDIGHVNLAWNGASIEATCRFLNKSISVDPQRLHIVMLPYPWRSESWQFWKGERNRRIKDTQEHSGLCAMKVGRALDCYKHENVVFTTTWGWTNEVLQQCEPYEISKLFH